MNCLTYKQDRRGLWRWQVKGGNNRIIGAASEGFASKANAKRNALKLLQALDRTLYPIPGLS